MHFTDDAMALTVRQPWAWALVHGHKDVENRRWMTNYRGRLWIHAAAVPVTATELSAIRHAFPDIAFPDTYTIGALIGFVTLTDVLVTSPSRWYQAAHFAWTVRDAVALREPIPMPGRLKLWEVPRGGRTSPSKRSD